MHMGFNGESIGVQDAAPGIEKRSTVHDSSSSHLEGHLRIELKLGHLLAPGEPLPGLVVQEVVVDGPLRGELDVLELCHPPL